MEVIVHFSNDVFIAAILDKSMTTLSHSAVIEALLTSFGVHQDKEVSWYRSFDLSQNSAIAIRIPMTALAKLLLEFKDEQQLWCPELFKEWGDPVGFLRNANTIHRWRQDRSRSQRLDNSLWPIFHIIQKSLEASLRRPIHGPVHVAHPAILGAFEKEEINRGISQAGLISGFRVSEPTMAALWSAHDSHGKSPRKMMVWSLIGGFLEVSAVKVVEDEAEIVSHSFCDITEYEVDTDFSRWFSGLVRTSIQRILPAPDSWDGKNPIGLVYMLGGELERQLSVLNEDKAYALPRPVCFRGNPILISDEEWGQGWFDPHFTKDWLSVSQCFFETLSDAGWSGRDCETVVQFSPDCWEASAIKSLLEGMGIITPLHRDEFSVVCGTCAWLISDNGRRIKALRKSLRDGGIL